MGTKLSGLSASVFSKNPFYSCVQILLRFQMFSCLSPCTLCINLFYNGLLIFRCVLPEIVLCRIRGKDCSINSKYIVSSVAPAQACHQREPECPHSFPFSLSTLNSNHKALLILKNDKCFISTISLFFTNI